jgi:hypothetical protein
MVERLGQCICCANCLNAVESFSGPEAVGAPEGPA